MNYYRNLKDVERDIEISKLKADIEEEKLKLRVAKVKQAFSGRSLVRNAFTNPGSKLSFFSLINAYMKRRKRRRAKGRR